MGVICQKHNLTTEHVEKLKEMIDAEIKEARADTGVSNEEFSFLFDLQRAVNAMGSPAEKKNGRKRDKKNDAKNLTPLPLSVKEATA